eukprot:12811154-Alexandrium_andersonii.AAC.1
MGTHFATLKSHNYEVGQALRIALYRLTIGNMIHIGNLDQLPSDMNLETGTLRQAIPSMPHTLVQDINAGIIETGLFKILDTVGGKKAQGDQAAYRQAHALCQAARGCVAQEMGDILD